MYGCAQMVFAYRAFRRARASDEPGREAALGRGFLLIFLWHASHFLAHEFKKPWAWFGSHYFYIFGFFQLARARELDARRDATRRDVTRLPSTNWARLTAWGARRAYAYRGRRPPSTDVGRRRTGRTSVGRHVRRARAIRGLPDGRREDGPVRAAVDSRRPSIAAASLFGAVEILFCHRLGKLGATTSVGASGRGSSSSARRSAPWALEGGRSGSGPSELAGA